MEANEGLKRELSPEEEAKRKERHQGHKAKKGFFDSIFGDKQERIKYEEFDTLEDEDLDVTPEWLQDRPIKTDELEDFISQYDKVKTIKFQHGSSRASNDVNLLEMIDFDKVEGVQTMGYLKGIFLEDGPDMNKNIQMFKTKMAPRQFICRVYILDGVDIADTNTSEPISTYIKVRMGEEVKSLKDSSMREGRIDPDYYVSEDFKVEVPGCAFLTVEVWKNNDVLKDEMIGYTKIDIESRHFNEKWQSYVKKPIEYRTLWGKNNTTTTSRLAMWVELHPAESRVKQYNIAPYEKVPCELRVIVWDSRDFKHDDELTDASDLYVRGGISGDTMRLETDTCWRARGVANFNWRWKIPMTLPIDASDYNKDKLLVQLWDRDIITSNTMIGEAQIDLNQHKLLDKVYKRRSGVKIRKKAYDKEKKANVATEKIYYHVFGDEQDSKGNKVSQVIRM